METSTDEKRLQRLIFIGSFGEYFLWSLLMILGIIPILGTWFQFLFVRWMTRNTVLVPFEITDDDMAAILQSRKARDVIKGEMTKI